MTQLYCLNWNYSYRCAPIRLRSNIELAKSDKCNILKLFPLCRPYTVCRPETEIIYVSKHSNSETIRARLQSDHDRRKLRRDVWYARPHHRSRTRLHREE